MEISEVPRVLPSGSSNRTPPDDDLAIQAATLSRVLDTHPAGLTVSELASEEADLGTRDAIERAVRDLVGVGLLHLHGQLLSPTHAALRDRELLDR